MKYIFLGISLILLTGCLPVQAQEAEIEKFMYHARIIQIEPTEQAWYMILPNGVHCVYYKVSNGAAIDCDWTRYE